MLKGRHFKRRLKQRDTREEKIREEHWCTAGERESCSISEGRGEVAMSYTFTE